MVALRNSTDGDLAVPSLPDGTGLRIAEWCTRFLDVDSSLVKDFQQRRAFEPSGFRRKECRPHEQLLLQRHWVGVRESCYAGMG
jgi:hypothetical protein